MELLMSLGIGGLVAGGIWLVLRERSFSFVLGLTLLSYAANLFIFVSGRLGPAAPPLSFEGHGALADPLPHALVLTAIVISFGMTAYLVALALRAVAETGSDRMDGP